MSESVPTLHLLYGLPGSGKTTLARRLERESKAVRFSPDEWMVALHGPNPPEAIFRPQQARILALVWLHIERVLRAGTDAIFDGGVWTRAARDEARGLARACGSACRLHVLRCGEAEARRRVRARTAALPPGTLEISEATFDFLLRQIEPIGADEAHEIVEPGDLSGRA